jgi:hypothetical protein
LPRSTKQNESTRMCSVGRVTLAPSGMIVVEEWRIDESEHSGLWLGALAPGRQVDYGHLSEIV